MTSHPNKKKAILLLFVDSTLDFRDGTYDLLLDCLHNFSKFAGLLVDNRFT